MAAEPADAQDHRDQIASPPGGSADDKRADPACHPPRPFSTDACKVLFTAYFPVWRASSLPCAAACYSAYCLNSARADRHYYFGRRRQTALVCCALFYARARKVRCSSSSGFGLSISEPPESGDAGPRRNRHCRLDGNITRTFKIPHQNFFCDRDRSAEPDPRAHAIFSSRCNCGCGALFGHEMADDEVTGGVHDKFSRPVPGSYLHHIFGHSHSHLGHTHSRQRGFSNDCRRRNPILQPVANRSPRSS